MSSLPITSRARRVPGIFSRRRSETIFDGRARFLIRLQMPDPLNQRAAVMLPDLDEFDFVGGDIQCDKRAVHPYVSCQ